MEFREKLQNLRKSQGMSQEKLAELLNVSRQAVSKWESGLSVPDLNMLISLAEELDTSVSILLGETIDEDLNEESIKSISEKLEVINLQLAKRSEVRIRTIHYLLISLCVIIIIGFIVFMSIGSEYLNWDFNNPELAIAGTILQGIEFLFVRIAPFIFIGSIIGIIFTYKSH